MGAKRLFLRIYFGDEIKIASLLYVSFVKRFSLLYGSNFFLYCMKQPNNIAFLSSINSSPETSKAALICSVCTGERSSVSSILPDQLKVP
jgi:hypothetical protein